MPADTAAETAAETTAETTAQVSGNPDDPTPAELAEEARFHQLLAADMDRTQADWERRQADTCRDRIAPTERDLWTQWYRGPRK